MTNRQIAIAAGRTPEFIESKVDIHGKVSDSYRNDTPRYLWAAQQVAQEALEKELRPSLDKVVSEMKAHIAMGIAQVVNDLVARNFSR